MILRRRPLLPVGHHDAWWCFVDCVDVLEAGKRQLLATLPAGRVEPAPIGVGLDAIAGALEDARRWMPGWRVEELAEVWRACDAALDEAAAAVPVVRRAAAQPGELDDIISEMMTIIDPLDTFADAELAWRGRWRLPGRRSADRPAGVGHPDAD